jgi:hypothetical protein
MSREVAEQRRRTKRDRMIVAFQQELFEQSGREGTVEPFLARGADYEEWQNMSPEDQDFWNLLVSERVIEEATASARLEQRLAETAQDHLEQQVMDLLR